MSTNPINDITLPMKSTEHIPIKYRPIFKSDLKEIEELYNKLGEMKITFTTSDIAKNIYASCAMEGAVSSVADSINLLNSTKNPSNHSEQMIYNYLDLINNPLGSKLFDDVLNIRKVLDILSKNAIDDSDSGYPFRSSPVWIANPFTGHIYHKGLDEQYIERYLNTLYDYLKTTKEHPFITSAILHFYFEHIHPFSDCNGRVGRYLMTEYLVTKGYEKFICLPINTVLYRDKHNYDASLRVNYKNPNITNHIKYMLDAYKVSLLMCIYVNSDTDIGVFLREQTDKFMPLNTPVDILDKLYSNNLMDINSTDYNLMLSENLTKAINIYNYGLD